MGRGALVFKGEKQPKSKSKSKKRKSSKKDGSIIASGQQGITSDINTSSLPNPNKNATKHSNSTQNNTPTIQKGTGQIITSGTVVTGFNTKFRSEFISGDAIIVKFEPQNQDQGKIPKEEMRVITMCLSDTSCAISSAFSTDLRAHTSFSFVRKPKDEQKEREEARSKQKEDWMETERTAFGLYGSGSGNGGTGGNNVLIYRKKTETGSYVIKKEKLNEEVSRVDLLNMRAKKKSDRYC